MDRPLRRELQAVARNRTSGAAELALRAVQALQAWLRRHARPTERELLEIAGALLKAQPSMAPLLRLANWVAIAADSDDPLDLLAKELINISVILQTASERIARRFVAALRHRRRWGIVTYSYSSTVVKALCRAAPRIAWVRCSESRPTCEGRRTAKRLAGAGIPVVFETDASLFSGVKEQDLVVLGADQIGEWSFVNKVGTETISARAAGAGKPIWVLADTTKFLPWGLWLAASPFCVWPRPDGELWRNPPRRVTVSNYYFEPTHYGPGVRVLTELGWMTPAQVRQELKKIRIAPRWKALAD